MRYKLILWTSIFVIGSLICYGYVNPQVGYYSFDDADTSGSTLSEPINSYDGIQNATTSQSGVVNESYYFPTQTLVNLTSYYDNFGVSENEFSISFWFKLDDATPATNAIVLSDWYDVSSNHILIRQGTDGYLDFYLRDDGAANRLATTTSTLVSGKWYHIVAVANGTNVNLYVNKTFYTGDAYTAVTAGKGNTSIGNKDQPVSVANGNPLIGYIDEMAFWNTVLSAADVSDLYDKGVASESLYVVGDTTAPTLSNINCTTPELDTTEPYLTGDWTPTFELNTDESADCGISVSNGSYTACGTTGVKYHVCTVPSPGYTAPDDNYTYFNCTDSSSNSRTQRVNVNIHDAPQPSDNSTNGTEYDTNVEFRLKWTDDTYTGLAYYIFSFYNGTNWVQNNQSADRETGVTQYIADFSAGGAGSGNYIDESFENDDSRWTDASNLYVPYTNEQKCGSYGEFFDASGSGGQHTLTYNPTFNLSTLGATSANFTAWIFIHTGTETGDECCLDIYNGSAWDSGQTGTSECADAGSDPDGWPASVYYHELNANQLSNDGVQIRFICEGQNKDDFVIDCVNLTYTYNGGSGSGDVEDNKTNTTYPDNVNGTMYGNFTNITVTVQLSAWCNAGSSNTSNTDPDLLLHMYNGSAWENLGHMATDSTGNFTNWTNKANILSAWGSLNTNRDIRLQGVFFDGNASDKKDEINITGVWIEIQNEQKFKNDSPVAFTGVINWSNVTKHISTTEGATISWRVFANDTKGNETASIIYNFTTTAPAGPGDTCDCSSIQAGTTIDCTENCDVGSACDASGQDLVFDGAGTVEITADISNSGDVMIKGGCHVICNGGCIVS